MANCPNCEAEVLESNKFCNHSCVGSFYGRQTKLDPVARRAKWRARNKRYYKKNRDKITEKTRYRHDQMKDLGHVYKRNLLWRTKKRAQAKQLDFDLTIEDLHIPTHCPVLGLELQMGKGKLTDYSPSLDRIIPFLGYTKGNVIVVSYKANRIKSNATLSELREVADFYSKLKV